MPLSWTQEVKIDGLRFEGLPQQEFVFQKNYIYNETISSNREDSDDPFACKK